MSSQLTIQERDRIAQLHYQGADQKEIATALGRAASTISRELRRNSTGQQYHAGQAQQECERRRRERPLQRKLDTPELNAAVRAGLAQNWSPEQITGRLQQQHPQCPQRRVSAQTIYAWLRQDPAREHWESFLRRRGKRPHRRKQAVPGDGARKWSNSIGLASRNSREALMSLRWV